MSQLGQGGARRVTAQDLWLWCTSLAVYWGSLLYEKVQCMDMIWITLVLTSVQGEKVWICGHKNSVWILRIFELITVVSPQLIVPVTTIIVYTTDLWVLYCTPITGTVIVLLDPIHIKLPLHDAQDGWGRTQHVFSVSRWARNCVYTSSPVFVKFIWDDGNTHL